MIGKKINQLATELAPDSTDLTIIGDPISGVSKKITLAQLGAIFSGAVAFYTNLAAFPVTGDINVIYCAKDTQKLYLWSGSAYVEVFPSQALLNTYQLRSEKGVSNGYASLDSAGKVPIAQLPSSIMEYKGTWNAATNTPTLANGTGDTGDVYICNVAGTVNFGAGPLTFAVGDYVIYSGTIWQRSSGAVGTVTSVAASITGNSIGITGSPITTSGTLALAFAGTSAQYVNGAGNLITFPSIISEAQNLITEVYNKSGATITKGTVVYINGGQGNLPTIAKALATGDATSAQTYGIVQADITNMNNGYVVAAGRLGDLNTSAFTEGTQLYLSATTAGTYTSTKQYAPNHLVYIAIVVRAHPTQGVIEVKIQNGYEMDELHNVAAQSPSNGDILQYVTSTSLWTKTAGTTTNIAEGTNLYYTEARVNANTNVAANTAARHNAVTIGTANGLSLSTQVLSLALASGSTTGALSSTDWTTFNSKQNALTNPVTGTGASGQVTYFNGTSTVTGTNNHFWDATNNRLGIGTTTPQRSIEIFNSTADNHLRLSGNAPSVSMGEAVTGSIYQAKFGLVTVNGQFVTAGVAGDFVIISQTGATIIGTSSTEKMRVQSSGNVSINNTNDTYKLDVTGTGRFTGQLRLESTITDGTYTYTLPSATGTLALTSALSGYLPLTGGTLTGALNGTSASFSGNGLFGGSTNAGNAATYTLSVGLAGTTAGGIQLWAATNQTHFIQFGDGTAAADNYRGYIGYAHSTDTLSLGTAGADKLTIALTGAATLSSAGSVIPLKILNTTGTTLDMLVLETGWSNPSGNKNIIWKDATNTLGRISVSYDAGTGSTMRFGSLYNGGYQSSDLLTIASTGAATFSSSVSVGDFLRLTKASSVDIQAYTGAAYTNLNYDAASHNWQTSGGTAKMILNASGFLGIGTTAPEQLLDIKNSGGGTAYALIQGQGRKMYLGQDGTGSVIYSDGAAPMYFSTNATERMRITSGGNVGIGTSSPSSLLSISATQPDLGINYTSSSSYGRLIFNQSGTFKAAVQFVGSAFGDATRQNALEIYNESVGPINFVTSGIERMRITSGGDVGIGSTGSSGNRLVVKGEGTTGSYNAIYLQDSSSNDLLYIRCDGYINSGLKSVSPYNFSTAGRSLVVDSAGGIGYLVSTRDSKANIKSITNIDFINQLNPVQFNYRKKDITNNTFSNEVYENITYGFIADEVEKVNKELVFYNNDNTLAGVEYNSIIALLTKSVQELKKELEILKNK